MNPHLLSLALSAALRSSARRHGQRGLSLTAAPGARARLARAIPMGVLHGRFGR